MTRPLTTRKIPPGFFDLQPETRYAWLGMAGVLINARGTILLVDPLISTSVVDGEELCEGHYRLKVPLPIQAHELPKADAVLYTHADDDHFGLLTAQVLIEQGSCQFIAPPPILDRLQEMGAQGHRLITAVDFATIQMGEAEIRVTPALHDWQAVDPWRRGDCCGYLVQTRDGTIWHPGDTRLIPELLEIRNVDVLFFDVAAVEAHLGPQGSARLVESSGARIAVAYHYGTFDLPPGSFGGCDPLESLPYLTGQQVTFLQPNPGEVLQLSPDR